MNSHIKASFSYGGAADYPGSSFEGDFQFSSDSEDSAQAITDFVSWVNQKRAGVAAAIYFCGLTEENDPEGDFDMLMDQLVSFEITTSPANVPAIKVALAGIPVYALTKSVLTGEATEKTNSEFRTLVRTCLENENPGPLIAEAIQL